MNALDTNEVSVWIETTWGWGHAEVFHDGYFYGFWPDRFKRSRIPESPVQDDEDALLGGWVGDLRKRTETQLAAFYNGIYAKETKTLAEFHVFGFSPDPLARAGLSRIFEETLANPPEYKMRPTGVSHNCVTLSVSILRGAGILTESFSVPRREPTPAMLRKKLEELRAGTGAISHQIRRIEIANFKLVPEG